MNTLRKLERLISQQPYSLASWPILWLGLRNADGNAPFLQADNRVRTVPTVHQHLRKPGFNMMVYSSLCMDSSKTDSSDTIVGIVRARKKYEE